MAESDFLTFRGKPLVRKGNEIYYGDMSDPVVIRFEIAAKGKTAEITDQVKVQLLSSDIDRPMAERVQKESVKPTLFEALDIGFIWLERALKN